VLCSHERAFITLRRITMAAKKKKKKKKK